MKVSTGSVKVIDNIIISTGYNGTPRGVTNCCDNGFEDCDINHFDKP